MSWKNVLGPEFEQTYFIMLRNRIAEDREKSRVYPPSHHTMAVFEETPLESVKVVILGQDPYYRQGQAHGLSFSVPKGEKVPPSLRNIYKELESDIEGFVEPGHGFLLPWAHRGVFLLNTILTVREGSPGSHQGWGWETFTNRVIQILNDQDQHIVFLLWGRHAQQKAMFLDISKHTVLTAAHPSPLSAKNGFFGCKHFSLANQALIEAGREPVDWRLSSASMP